ncbi:MAG: hypothetical protein R2940_07200 [Syntrophotaleaceae bacterium]
MFSIASVILFNIPLLGLSSIFFGMKARNRLDETLAELASPGYCGKEIKPFVPKTWKILAIGGAVLSVLFTILYIGLFVHLQSELSGF